MRRRTFLGVAGTALTAAAASRLPLIETAKAATSPESFVLELERKWMDAMVGRDAATLKSLMADDFKRIEKPSPNIGMFKPQWIGNAVRIFHVETFKYLGLSASVSGTIATVNIRYRWRGFAEETPFNEIVAAEDRWEQREGRWQVVSRVIGSTVKVRLLAEKTSGQRKAIKLAPSLCLAYVGQYQFGDNRVLTISQEGNRLVHQGSGGHRAELFPETTSRFFRKDAGVLTTFVKDKNGQVTHVVHKHASGRVSVGKRLA